MRSREVLFSLALAFAVGCGSQDIIDPIYEIDDDHTLVVVPFSERDIPNGWESPRGADLATRVTKILGKRAEFQVKPVEALLPLYDDRNPRELSPAEIAEKVGADYVLTGHLKLWQLRDRGAVNALRGTSLVEVFIYESPALAAKKREKEKNPTRDRVAKAVAQAEVSGLYPSEYGLERYGEWDFGDEQEERIEEGLRSASAKRVSELLYGHTKEEAALGSDL
jgi:hypothetical protein